MVIGLVAGVLGTAAAIPWHPDHRARDRVTILAIGSGSYAVLYGVAGVCAIVGAVTILPVKRVR